MNESNEVADTLFSDALAANISSHGEACRFVAARMSGESPGGNVVGNVAWSLWMRIKEHRVIEANRAEIARQ